MRVLHPGREETRHGARMAPRLRSLDGIVLGFLDNIGYTHSDGRRDMYPLMAEVKRVLEQRYRIKSVLWRLKPLKGQVAPPEMIKEVAQADAVINGICL